MSKKHLIGAVLVLVVLVSGGVIYKLTPKSAKTVTTAPGAVVSYSTDQPDEKKPGSDYKWVGAPNEPKSLSLPSIDTTGFVQKVGVDQNNQIAVPNNIFMAGWFANSRLPGQKGLAIIDGHVDGRTVDQGVFGKLAQIKKDDVFSVELGNGTKLNYRVFAVESVDLKNAANVLFSQDPKVSSQLNLITCVGTYLREAKTYNQRLIVSASLM